MVTVGIHCHLATPASRAPVEAYRRPDFEPYDHYMGTASKDHNTVMFPSIEDQLTEPEARIEFMDRMGVDVQGLATFVSIGGNRHSLPFPLLSKQIIGVGTIDDAPVATQEFDEGPLAVLATAMVIHDIGSTALWGTEAAAWNEGDGKHFLQGCRSGHIHPSEVESSHVGWKVEPGHRFERGEHP